MAKQLKIKTSNTEWTNIDNLKLYELELLNNDTNTAKLSINGKNITVANDKFYFDAPIDLGYNDLTTNGSVIFRDTLNVLGIISSEGLEIKNDDNVVASLSTDGVLTLKNGTITYNDNDEFEFSSPIKVESINLNGSTITTDGGKLKLGDEVLKAAPYIYGNSSEPGSNANADQDLLYIQKITQNSKTYYILWAYVDGSWKRMNAIWG